MMENLLIADESEEIRNQLKWGLSKEYTLILASNTGNAISLFKRHLPKVVTLDLGLPSNQNSHDEGVIEMVVCHRYYIDGWISNSCCWRWWRL